MFEQEARRQGYGVIITSIESEGSGTEYALPAMMDLSEVRLRRAVAALPDGSYSAFGDTYGLDKFPELVAAAPKGLFLTGTALVDIDGDSASGTQPLCFIDHATHDMRIGYYRDTYSRTPDGWRLKTRAMTFIRRNGAHDSGRPHAYKRAGT